jgi:hypothetical protein
MRVLRGVVTRPKNITGTGIRPKNISGTGIRTNKNSNKTKDNKTK